MVDFNTPVPGGVGNLSDLELGDSNPLLRNGTVIFLGRDSNPSRTNVANGLYSMPVAGGQITKIADYNTADPTGGTFAVIWVLQ